MNGRALEQQQVISRRRDVEKSGRWKGLTMIWEDELAKRHCNQNCIRKRLGAGRKVP